MRRDSAIWLTVVILVALPASFLLSWHNPGGFNWADAPYYYLLYLLVAALAYGARTYRTQVKEREQLLARELVIEERTLAARLSKTCAGWSGFDQRPRRGASRSTKG